MQQAMRQSCRSPDNNSANKHNGNTTRIRSRSTPNESNSKVCKHIADRNGTACKRAAA